MRQGFPYAVPSQVIGLLGGSFDPPHEGHAHLTREALKRFGLDRVWWLVSPGNPLKSEGPAPLAKRLQVAKGLMQHPKVCVTDLEARIGTRYTAETLAHLKQIYPGVRFVWLMGADNLAQLHKWQDWRAIMEAVPVGVIARPGQRLGARRSRAALVYRNYRLKGKKAQLLGNCEAPAWSFQNVPLRPQSSTMIRKSGDWTRSDTVE